MLDVSVISFVSHLGHILRIMQSLSKQLKQSLVLLDGGMGSALESKLPLQIDSQPLWSASALIHHEDVVLQAHAEFAAAGCNILTAITYQLSPDGCKAHAAVGDETGEAAVGRMVSQAVSVARSAAAHSTAGKQTLIAGSVGPMGAAAHDGSEFTGAYEVTAASARCFHEARLRALHKYPPPPLTPTPHLHIKHCSCTAAAWMFLLWKLSATGLRLNGSPTTCL